MAVMMMFRTMEKEEKDGLPMIGDTWAKLGVRDRDIPIVNDLVQPGMGGMSVTDDPRYLPNTLRPTFVKSPEGQAGVSPHTLFVMEEEFLPTSLQLRLAKPNSHHFLIEPSTACDIEEYRQEVRKTRPHWKEWRG